MFYRKKLLFYILLLTGVPLASAQSMDEQQEVKGLELAKVARASYIRSQTLPISVAFSELLGILKVASDENPVVALSVITEGSGWSEAESQQFLSQALATREDLQADMDDSEVQIACSYMAAGDYSKQASYDALHLMDDTREALAEQYYWETKKTMDERTETEFDQWLESRKTMTMYIKIDHSKYRSTSATPVLERICGRTS